MKLGFSALFADAGVLWRANRDLLVRIAAVFFFLPDLAVELFAPMPRFANASTEEMMRIVNEWSVAQWPLLVGNLVVHVFGTAVLLVLLLDPERPSLAGAMRRALPLLPVLLVAWLLVTVLTTLGTLLLVIPGLYLSGRLYLVVPALVAEAPGHPIRAASEGVARTRGNVLVLLSAAIVVLLVTWIAGGVSGSPDPQRSSAVVVAIASLLTAAVTTAGALAQILLQAAAYRATSPRQGI